MPLDTLYPVTSYAGTALNTDSGGQHRIILWVQRGLWDLPETRGVDTILPSSPGRVPRARVVDDLTIELGGWVYGTGADAAAMKADIQAAMLALRTLFDPTRADSELKVGLEDGTTFARIQARPLNLLELERPDPVARSLSIELEAVNPPTWQIGEDVTLPLNAQLGTQFDPTISGA